MEYIDKNNVNEIMKKYNIDSDEIQKYEFIHPGGFLCNIKEYYGRLYYITDKKFSESAKSYGFTETSENDVMSLLADTVHINGYKNFGYANVEGNKVYWMCKASNGEDEKIPSNLDYFRISESEFKNKIIVKENIDSVPIISMTVQDARNSRMEEERIKCSILGIAAPGDVSFSKLTASNTDNDEDKPKRNYHVSGVIPKLNSGFRTGYEENDEYLDDDDEDDEEGQNKKMGFIKNLDIPQDKLIKMGGIFGIVVFLFIVIKLLLSAITPSNDMMDLIKYYNIENNSDIIISYNNNCVETRGSYIGNEYYLPYEFVKEKLNHRIYYDKNEDVMILSGTDAIRRVQEDRKYVATDGKKQQLRFPTYQIKNDGSVWVSLEFIGNYSAFEYEKFEKPYRVSITNYENREKEYIVTAQKDTVIRYGNSPKSPILSIIKTGEKANFLETVSGWTKISYKGLEGYVQADNVSAPVEEIYGKEVKEEFKHNLYNGKICMLWHQVTNKSANANIKDVIEKSDGANIISPTWFYINDSNGGLEDFGSTEYVDECHKHDIFVWGLVSNIENPNIDTGKILSHTSKRTNLINNIISVAEKYNLDGINIDFESLKYEDGESFIQFIRELSIALDKTNIVLSIDNYVPSDYTMFYDREEQANYADYIVLMAYDEYTSASKQPGSTASYPWVKDGVDGTLKEVPNNQLILGIPFYSRIWKQEEDGYSSKTVGIESILKEIEENNAEAQWDKNMSQFYTSYTGKDGVGRQIWVEEENSITKKLELMRKNNLAGAAFWKSGLEPESMWKTISNGYTGGNKDE